MIQSYIMWVKLLLLFFVFSFFLKTDTSFDQDLGRHIKLGEIITQTHQIPRTNLFSYTNPDFPFINTHWLFEMLMYFFHQAGALQMLLIIKIIIIIFSVWLVLRIIPKQNQALLLPIGFIFLHVLRERVELRPEIFSFLFTASTYYILERYLKEPTKLIFLLPLIQLLWINTHIYFFVGLILQAIFLLHLSIQKLRVHPKGVNIKLSLIIFILSVIVSLINSNGLAGFLYPLNVTKNYGYTIAENQTMFLLESINFRDPNFLFVKISAGIIVLSIIISLLKRRLEVKNIFLSLSGLTLALANVRSFPYLVFLSLPAVMANFGVIKRNFFTSFLMLVTCALLLIESFLYLNGSYYKYRDNQHEPGLSYIESGQKALDFMLANDLPGPIFNNFDIGSYIIYRTWTALHSQNRAYPKLKVFVDGRPEAYPAQFFQGIYIPAQLDYKNFKEVEKLYGFKTIIFSHTDQTPWGRNFLSSVIKDGSWKLIYIDDFMVVLVKPEILAEKKLKPVDLATLKAKDYELTSFFSYIRLGIFLLNNQYANGSEFIQRALELNPNSPFANSIMASITNQIIYQQRAKNFFFW